MASQSRLMALRAPFPQNLFTPHHLVTKDNIRDYLSSDRRPADGSPLEFERDANGMTFALQRSAVRKSFGGVEVLHGVDLDAIGGSVLALLGENGAGKSTLVKIIAGDYQADAGEIEVEGVSYGVLTPRQARDLGVAIIFQEFQDASTLTVAENISLGRIPNRHGIVSWRAMRERAQTILDQLGVELDVDRRGRHPAGRRAPDGRDRHDRFRGPRDCSSSMSRPLRSPTTRRRRCSGSSGDCATRAWPSSTSPTAWTR